MPNIYQLAAEYQNLYNALVESADAETGEVSVDIADALERAQGTFEEKAVATATVYRMLGEESERVENAIARLESYKNKLDKEAERVKTTLSVVCQKTGVTSLRGMYANISFRNSEKTVVDNIEDIPDEFIRVKVERSPMLNEIKAAIKAAEAQGATFPGAHIEKIQNIQIK